MCRAIPSWYKKFFLAEIKKTKLGFLASLWFTFSNRLIVVFGILYRWEFVGDCFTLPRVYCSWKLCCNKIWISPSRFTPKRSEQHVRHETWDIIITKKNQQSWIRGFVIDYITHVQKLAYNEIRIGSQVPWVDKRFSVIHTMHILWDDNSLRGKTNWEYAVIVIKILPQSWHWEQPETYSSKF